MTISVTDAFVCICFAYVLSFTCMNKFNKNVANAHITCWTTVHGVRIFRGNIEPYQSLSGAVPRMDWEAEDIESTWKTFNQHANFMFSWPLKEKLEPEQCLYLMFLVGEKGRTIYSAQKLSEMEQKNFEKMLRNSSIM